MRAAPLGNMMADPTSASIAMTMTAEAETLICHACGYDLRGIASERCPECGTDVDRSPNAWSQIPWVHRSQIGRVRAWVSTVWRLTWSVKPLVRDMSRPVSLPDARRFWLITAALLSVIPLAVVLRLALIENGFEFILQPAMPVAGIFGGAPRTTAPDWLRLNFMAPWTVGMTRLWVAPLAMALAVLFLTGVHVYLFRPRDNTQEQATRATALAYYLIAPWFIPLLLISLYLGWPILFPEDASQVLDRWLPRELAFLNFLIPVDWLWKGIILLFVLNAAARMVLGLHRLTRCGIAYVGFAIIAWPVLWSLCIVYALGFLPWVVGVAWFAIASMK